MILGAVLRKLLEIGFEQFYAELIHSSSIYGIDRRTLRIQHSYITTRGLNVRLQRANSKGYKSTGLRTKGLSVNIGNFGIELNAVIGVSFHLTADFELTARDGDVHTGQLRLYSLHRIQGRAGFLIQLVVKIN